MKKFTCGHCGGRIAVTPRNLGKLVVCPDCGKTTHPLAADILASANQGPPAVRSPSAEPIERKCENCGRKIGRLETLQVWQNHLVCDGCHTQLKPPEKKTEKKPKTLPVESQIIEPATTELVRRPPTGMDGQSTPSSLEPIRVMVSRTLDTSLRHPGLTAKQRVIVLLTIVCVAGAAVYGALTLLRDLAGVFMTVAVVLLAVAVGVAVVGATVRVVRRRWPMFWAKSPAVESTSDVAVRRE